MNKSLITNLVSLTFLAIGWYTQQQWLFSIGLFAFSGALTNWLAVHMLFEKVPGLYGSGVIPNRFEEIKLAIRALMMEQFFTQENIDKFLHNEMAGNSQINLQPVLQEVDFEPTFHSLINVIQESPLGGMLVMFGGAEALDPLKQPFIEKMRRAIIEISESEEVKQALRKELESPKMMDEITANIELIISQRLDELTPQLVKQMVQDMIKSHLGWLVIWGGIFGGLIGLLSHIIF